MSNVQASEHPLVRAQLARLRDVQTGSPEFRRLARGIATLLVHEATADLNVRPVPITTPMGTANCMELAESVAIVPILRAGLGMADAVLELIPDAEVWHVGLFRDETTLQPTTYYNKLPARCRASVALVVDPMLATGGSAIRTCEILRDSGIGRIKLLCLIAAPEGIARINEHMPEVTIHVGAIDERLNEVGFIVPGLGDAGDRLFGTGRREEDPR